MRTSTNGSKNSSVAAVDLDLYTGEDPPLGPDLGTDLRSLPLSLAVRAGPDHTTPSLRADGDIIAVRVWKNQKRWLRVSGVEIAPLVRQMIDRLMANEAALERARLHGEEVRATALKELHLQAAETRSAQERHEVAFNQELAEMRREYGPYRARGLPDSSRVEWVRGRREWYRLLRKTHPVDLLRLLEAKP